MSILNIDLLYDKLSRLEFLKKYIRQTKTNILELIVSFEQFSRFSWTSLCIKILNFYTYTSIPSSEQQLALETFGIATRLLDDLIDKDNHVLLKYVLIFYYYCIQTC